MLAVCSAPPPSFTREKHRVQPGAHPHHTVNADTKAYSWAAKMLYFGFSIAFSQMEREVSPREGRALSSGVPPHGKLLLLFRWPPRSVDISSAWVGVAASVDAPPSRGEARPLSGVLCAPPRTQHVCVFAVPLCWKEAAFQLLPRVVFYHFPEA